MPELPDITIYLESLEHHVVGQQLGGYALRSPFGPGMCEAYGMFTAIPTCGAYLE